jgi:hypothetical protein
MYHTNITQLDQSTHSLTVQIASLICHYTALVTWLTKITAMRRFTNHLDTWLTQKHRYTALHKFTWPFSHMTLFYAVLPQYVRRFYAVSPSLLIMWPLSKRAIKECVDRPNSSVSLRLTQNCVLPKFENKNWWNPFEDFYYNIYGEKSGDFLEIKVQGPMLWFFKYFRQKIQRKNWRFWLEMKLNCAKFWS